MENLAEKTENMEVATATEETQSPAEQPSLAEAVQESKDAISSADPVKRRGRPKKDANAPAKEKPKKEAAAVAQVPAPPPPTYLKPVINFPFQAMAVRTGWPGWNLSDKEQEDNAVLLDMVMRRYLPQLQSEHAELVGLALGLGMAAVSRYLAFQALLQAAQANAAPTDQGDVVRSQPAEPAINPTKMEKINAARNNKNRKETDPAVKPATGLASFLDNGPQNSPQI